MCLHAHTTQIKYTTHTTGGTLSAFVVTPSLPALINPFLESLIDGKDLKGDFIIVRKR